MTNSTTPPSGKSKCCSAEIAKIASMDTICKKCGECCEPCGVEKEQTAEEKILEDFGIFQATGENVAKEAPVLFTTNTTLNKEILIDLLKSYRLQVEQEIRSKATNDHENFVKENILTQFFEETGGNYDSDIAEIASWLLLKTNATERKLKREHEKEIKSLKEEMKKGKRENYAIQQFVGFLHGAHNGMDVLLADANIKKEEFMKLLNSEELSFLQDEDIEKAINYYNS